MQRGQVGQPRPEPVSRTGPPVTRCRCSRPAWPNQGAATPAAAAIAVRRRSLPLEGPGGRGRCRRRPRPSSTSRAPRRAPSTGPPACRCRARRRAAAAATARAAVRRSREHDRAAGHQQQVDQVRPRPGSPRRAGPRRRTGPSEAKAAVPSTSGERPPRDRRRRAG